MSFVAVVVAGGAVTAATISAVGSNKAAGKQAAAVKAAAQLQTANNPTVTAQPMNSLLGLSNTQLAIGGASVAAVIIALSGRR